MHDLQDSPPPVVAVAGPRTSFPSARSAVQESEDFSENEADSNMTSDGLANVLNCRLIHADDLATPVAVAPQHVASGTQQQDQLKALEAQRKKAEEEKQKLEDEAKRKTADEEKQRAEAEAQRKKADEEKQRLEAQRKKAEEDKLAETQRQKVEAEAQRKKAEEEKAKAEAEAQRKKAEEEKQRVEAEKQKVEAQRKKAEEEKQRLEAEAARQAELKKAEMLQKQAEEEAKRKLVEQAKALTATSRPTRSLADELNENDASPVESDDEAGVSHGADDYSDDFDEPSPSRPLEGIPEDSLEEEQAAATAADTTVRFFQAKFDYNPEEGPNQDEEELSFEEGDCFAVFGDADEDGFYHAKNKFGDPGVIPSNFVEEVDLMFARSNCPELVEAVQGKFCINVPIFNYIIALFVCLWGLISKPV